TLPGKVAPDPKELGQVVTDLHKKPGQLRDMLGADDIKAQSQASGSIRSSTSCHLRWPRPCSRASRLWWSSASWADSAALTPAQKRAGQFSDASVRHAVVYAACVGQLYTTHSRS